MKKNVIIIALGLFMCCNQSLFGQAPSGEQEDMQQKAMQSFMEPGPMHKLLASCDGVWDEEITMWLDPSAPPITSKGTCVNSMILGGRYQESRYTGEFNGMPFEGISIWGFNNGTKMFESTWIDNMGTSIMYTEGRYDEKAKTITFRGKSTDPVTGKPVTVRETFRFIDDNNQAMEMYEMKDGKEGKTMSILFTRRQ